jgi:predicted nuclease with TOPRIM domain
MKGEFLMTIDKIEKKISRIDEELAAAKEKLDECKNKVSALEKERESAENLRIIQIVRSTEITPETLKNILNVQKKEAENFIGTTVLPEIIPEKETVILSKFERKYENENENETD